MRKYLIVLCLWACCIGAWADEVVWYDGQQPVGYQVQGKVVPVVEMALRMFCDDMHSVLAPINALI